VSKDERFENLYREYYPRVVAFFVAKGCTRDEAREMAQETFLRVYRGMDGFRDESKLETWTFKIARNLFLNELRYWRSRGGRHRTRSLQELESTENGEQTGKDAASSDPSPLELAEQEEQMRHLATAIDELPPQQRVCVRYRLQGLKYREIAKLTGKSIETVKSLLHEAKVKLRLRLKGELPDLDESDEEAEP